MITDFHTHAFPDAIAEHAMRTLLAETTNVKAWLDGRVGSLLASMDRAGIGRSVLCSIATKPEQFAKILAWSAQARSERVVPFPSFHPRDPDPCARVREIAAAGFRGVKLHPYYQDFYLDDERMTPAYRAVAGAGLVLVCHTGFDVAFPRVRRCDPQRIARVVERVPDLKLVTTHLGSWSDWDEVEKHLLGRPVHMEISYSLEELTADRARSLLSRHPAQYILFGTDSPWQDQSAALARLRALGFGARWESAVLEENAARLLGDAGSVTDLS